MNHVFVWTIGDTVAFVFCCLLVLGVLFIGALILWERLVDKVKGWFK